MAHRRIQSVLSLALSVVLALGLTPLVSPAWADESPRDPVVSTVPVSLAEQLSDAPPVEVDEAEEGEAYAEGEVLVVLAPEATAAEADSVLEEARVEPLEAVTGEGLAGQDVVTVAIEDGSSVAEKVEELQARDDVVYAQPNYKYASEFVPNDPVFTQSTRFWWHLDDIAVPRVWDSVRTDGSVKVATIDSGVNTAHEDLVSVLDIQHAYNTTTHTAGAAAVQDSSGHGTHVAGIIAAEANNGIGVAGVSYNADVLPIRVIFDSGQFAGYGSTTSVTEGIRYAASVAGVRVINVSMGVYSDDAIMKATVDSIAAQGIVIVGAGGNKGIATPSYPADYDSVVSVSWYDQAGAIDSMSDYGAGKNIAAPGRSIYSTYRGASDSYATLSGSSMAAPVVAGVCALMFAANPYLTGDEVKAALYRSATDAGAAGWDPYFGYGKVNASGAVAAAQSTFGNYALSDATIADLPNVVYTGRAHSPAINATYRGIALKEGVDYTVSYANNTALGTATATISGIGLFSGQVTKQFRIYEDYTAKYGLVDLDGLAWYADDGYLDYMLDNGYLKGYSDSPTFGPYDNVTRGQVATVLWRMEGEASTGTHRFDDVPDDAYYATAIRWAYEEGIVNGYTGTNRFAPDSQVTREELAAMLANYAAYKGVDTHIASPETALSGFPDRAAVSGWSTASLAWCVKNGLMAGKDVGGAAHLDPQGTSWRASLATMVGHFHRDML